MSIGKIFRKNLRNLIRWATLEDDPVEGTYTNQKVQAPYPGTITSGRSKDIIPTTFNISVTSATGGKVITVRHYDQHTDRSSENVYIVTDKEDLGEELGQIITKESLSK